jgi:tetratricopeptide (TPR) repeat protein
MFPDSDKVLTLLAFTYAKIGHIKEGLPFAELAVRHYPDDPDLWVNVGTLRLLDNNVPGARQACDKALAIAPQNSDAKALGLKLTSQNPPSP